MAKAKSYNKYETPRRQELLKPNVYFTKKKTSFLLKENVATLFRLTDTSLASIDQIR